MSLKNLYRFTSLDRNRIPVLAVPEAPVLNSLTPVVEGLGVNITPQPDGGSPILTYKYQLDGGSFIDAGTADSEFTIPNLDVQEYTVRVVAVNVIGESAPSNSLSATPLPVATVPDAPTITSVNSGNEEIFINIALGNDGGSPVTDIEYRLNSGSWQSAGTTTSPLVIPAANGVGHTIEVRAVNAVGNSPASNSVAGEASQALELQRYFIIDEDMADDVQDLTFGMRQASGSQVIYEYNDGTPDEPWEESPDGPAVPGVGNILVDHQGNLRIYYELRFPNSGGDNPFGLALMKSTDGGQTWFKDRINKNTGLVNDSDSNLCGVPIPPGGSTPDMLRSPKVMYDPNAPTSQRYKLIYKWRDGLSETFVATSGDGETFSNPTTIIDSVAGDNHPGSLFFDTNENDWVIFGRGRGRGGSSPPSSGPPKPYEDTRWVYIATSNSFDGTYSVDEQMIDPADVWNYSDEADGASFWNSINDGCGNGWEPDSSTNAEIRPDIYAGSVVFHHGQYIGIFPTFFRDDKRVTRNRLDRTTGQIYPVWAHARVRDQLHTKYGGVEGGWNFPEENTPAVDLTPFLRTNTDSCATAPGVNEVGQFYSHYMFAVKDGTMIVPVFNRVRGHYEGTNTSLADIRQIAITTLTEDRFARYQAGGTEGAYTSKKIYIPDGATKLIVNTSAQNGPTRVEVLNGITGSPIDGFTRADSIPFNIDTKGGEEAGWQNRSISELTGQNCRLKFYLNNGSIYAWRFE